jgi:hypothetical protein
MRYVLLLLPLIAIGCADGYERGYAGDDYYASPNYYAEGYGYSGYYDRHYYGEENCGTPYEPKACPPLPRHPLPYYPD